jgi:hypothetical protein
MSTINSPMPQKARDALDAFLGSRRSAPLRYPFFDTTSRTVIRPHRLYRCAVADPRTSINAVSLAAVGWRCFIANESNELAAVDVFRCAGKQYVCRLQLGEAPRDWLRQIKRVERRKLVRDGLYNMRILEMPAISFECLWLCSRDADDLFLALNRTSVCPPRKPWMSRIDLESLIKASLSRSVELHNLLKQRKKLEVRKKKEE